MMGLDKWAIVLKFGLEASFFPEGREWELKILEVKILRPPHCPLFASQKGRLPWVHAPCHKTEKTNPLMGHGCGTMTAIHLSLF